jgi:hypothetical protein
MGDRPMQGACRPMEGRQAPISENFQKQHIFLKFCFFKYKKEKVSSKLYESSSRMVT